MISRICRLMRTSGNPLKFSSASCYRRVQQSSTEHLRLFSRISASGEEKMSNLWQDLRYGLRLLRLNPGFTAFAVLALALGTDANTSIFQVIGSLRLRRRPRVPA